jgi:hypothetical protein
MGFFRRTRDNLDVVKLELEAGLDARRNLPTTTEGMNARMEAIVAKQEAGLAQAQQATRLATSGVDTLATLRAVVFNQQPHFLQATIEWTVQPVGGAPYEARSVGAVQPELVPSLVPGAQCTLKVDPHDPQAVMLYNYGPDWTPPTPQAPGAPAAPASASDSVDRVVKLAELHTAGLITDDEFASHKAEILGS